MIRGERGLAAKGQVPYFDDINVNDVHAALKGLISEIKA
jgi:hypothetical protein